ncbi:MAG: peptidylprolyl isomerase [bacterium]|nr:peptidylprolyl isomerase [bacterium]
MATDKRERQRAHRQVAQQRAKVTATRGRIRSRGVRVALIVLAIVVAVVILWLWARDDGNGGSQTNEPVDQSAEGEAAGVFPDLPPPPAPGGELSGEVTPCPDSAGPAFRVTSFESAPSQCLDPGLEYTAVFDTGLGTIRVALDQETNPEAVNAFAVLAGYDYYDGTAIFYTDPTGGYIQGGSPHTNGPDDPGPGFTVKSGDSVDYQAGQLLWSAEGGTTGQFLLLAEDGSQPSLSVSGLTVLGRISDGSLAVVLDTLALHVDNPDTAFGGRPSEAVIINSIDIQTTDPTPEGSIDLSGCPPADGSGPQVLDFDGPQPMCLDTGKQYTAVFDTTAGEMRIALDVVNTPITANNFAVLARYHYYDDTLLFRTDPGIGIIQGGAPHTNSPSDPGPGYTIPDEGSGFTYEPGQIVMARTAAPNSASAQFFFAVNENTALLNNQGTYVVFGQMDGESLAVAEAILASHEDQPGNRLGGAPSPQVIVNSVTIEESG